MTPAQWQRVRAMFEALVECDPAEAQRRLDAEIDDHAVKAEVASLLDHHSRAGSFLTAPAAMETGTDEAGWAPRGDLTPGSILGSYSIIREIGHGGMGRVYLATDEALERQVCLKAVRTELAADPVFRERLKREARLAASLNHPGICAVYALEEFDGTLYLVTEFIDGNTLRDEIRRGRRPSAEDVLATLREIAAALAAAHVKGITHRDLKPENVMRSSDGRLKILDFGLARTDAGSRPPHATAATMAGVLVGTPGYMSPEQITGGPTDRRADLFALGVLMYELATGTHPFAGATPLATIARILEHEPDPLHDRRPDLAPAVIDAVDRCLRKNPADRFATASDVVAALGADILEEPRTRDRSTWWRLHQIVTIGLYLTACAAAWQLKEWEPSSLTRWAFLIIGIFSAINGVVRGNLLFTERTHPRRLGSERQRTRRLSLALDVGIALALFAVASLASETRPVIAVLIMGLAAGIATAAVFIEPGTSAAAFDRR